MTRTASVLVVLRHWLAPESVDEFRHAYWHKQPFARPGAAASTVEDFQWRTLAEIVARGAPDLLTTARGRLVNAPPPRNLADVRSFMRNGVGVVIRRAERCHPGLARLAAAFAEDLPGEVHLQLFVTPAATSGFGWHYDVEDVFIVQTAGVKDYYFRANTIDPARPRDVRPDFALVRRETAPIGTCRLIAGDWLYVPARWWHVGKCIEDALSISVGVLATEDSTSGGADA